MPARGQPNRDDPYRRDPRDDPYRRDPRDDPYRRDSRDDPYRRDPRDDPYRRERQPAPQDQRKDPYSRARPAQREATDTMVLSVELSKVGSIIGTGGETIRRIQRESGAHLHVESRNEIAPGAKERKVTITGSTDAVNTAFELVQKAVENASGPPRRQNTGYMPPGAGNTHERALPLGTGNGNLKNDHHPADRGMAPKAEAAVEATGVVETAASPPSDAKPTLTQDQLNLLNSLSAVLQK